MVGNCDALTYIPLGWQILGCGQSCPALSVWLEEGRQAQAPMMGRSYAASWRKSHMALRGGIVGMDKAVLLFQCGPGSTQKNSAKTSYCGQDLAIVMLQVTRLWDGKCVV